MKCDKCEHKKYYSTGGDEYPAYTTIPYCKKGHWEDDPEEESKNGRDIWHNCYDFKLLNDNTEKPKA